jgi:glucose-6-phosphate 1-epimerase
MEPMDEISELDRQFGIPNVAKVVAGNGGLAKVVIKTPVGQGEIYLHGAHVTSWIPADAAEVLFVSAKSRWEDGRAIRGGVPICFPWFANKADDPRAPGHGFVRTTTWLLESIAQGGNAATVNMFTKSNDMTKKWWPVDFHLVYRATFGIKLSLELVVRNTGKIACRFEEALHSYFRVDQIEKARLNGLNGVYYLDKTDSNQKKLQPGPVEISSETDRVYLNTKGAVKLEDQYLRRRIHVEKENSLTTVVWNPWVEKAKGMSDFDDDEWRRMVCIETSNVSDFAVELAPGQEHKMQATVRLVEL